MAEELEPVFDALRTRILHATSGMNVAVDTRGNLVLKTAWIEPGKKESAWFGTVQQKRSYVSYHLMPIYTCPELDAHISPELRKRMQGKSCFNFKKVETELFDALEALTGLCASAYAQPTALTPHGR